MYVFKDEEMLFSVAGHSSSVGLGHMLRAARIAQSILTTCRALGAYLRRNSHTLIMLLCASIAIQYFVNSTIVPLFDETMSRDNASSRGCHRGRRVPAAMGPSCGMVQCRRHEWSGNSQACEWLPAPSFSRHGPMCASSLT